MPTLGAAVNANPSKLILLWNSFFPRAPVLRRGRESWRVLELPEPKRPTCFILVFEFSELEVTAAVVSFHVKHTFSLQYGYIAKFGVPHDIPFPVQNV